METKEILRAEIGKGPTAPSVLKVIRAAEDNGWIENDFGSLVLRYRKPNDPDALPFFVTWHIGMTAGGKVSYRFAGARVINGKPLALNDVLIYLADPTVIQDEDPNPESGGENAGSVQ